MDIDNWKQFLQSQSAVVSDKRVLHFNADTITEKRAALHEHVLCDLSHYSLIQVKGDDAQSFLQNQFCNDVRLVNATQSQLSAYCNPKGRALAFFRLFQRGDAYYLRLPNEITEPTLKRLRMYVLMSKVTLDDVSEELIRIGYSGPQADQKLQALVDGVPMTTDTVTQTGNLTIVRIADTKPRFEIYGELEAIKALWQSLARDAQPVGSDSWDLLEIHAGMPEILPETVEAFVPQMINLQAINALSFKKGCYPGQEIVARMHYLGKLKRRMYLVHADTDTVPDPGTALYAADAETDQGVGKVVRAQASPDGGVDLLAVIEIASAEQRQIRLENARGPLMKMEKLPYMVEESTTTTNE